MAVNMIRERREPLASAVMAANRFAPARLPEACRDLIPALTPPPGAEEDWEGPEVRRAWRLVVEAGLLAGDEPGDGQCWAMDFDRSSIDGDRRVSQALAMRHEPADDPELRDATVRALCATGVQQMATCAGALAARLVERPDSKSLLVSAWWQCHGQEVRETAARQGRDDAVRIIDQIMSETAPS